MLHCDDVIVCLLFFLMKLYFHFERLEKILHEEFQIHSTVSNVFVFVFVFVFVLTFCKIYNVCS